MYKKSMTQITSGTIHKQYCLYFLLVRNIRWISDRNRFLNKLAYYIQLSYFYIIKIAKLYVISLLMCVSITIGNPPYFYKLNSMNFFRTKSSVQIVSRIVAYDKIVYINYTGYLTSNCLFHFVWYGHIVEATSLGFYYVIEQT